MAAISAFTYSLPPGPLHGRDPRIKLFALVILSIAALAGCAASLVPVVALVVAAFIYAGRPLLRTIGAMKPLLLIALFVIVSRAVSLSAQRAPVFVSDGALTGASFAARLLTVALLGHLFITSTSRGSIIDTLTWACTPLPEPVRLHLPLAVAIALSSYPLMARSMRRINEACRVRGAHPQRNPRLAATVIARGALDDVPLRISRVADAMSVRGLAQSRTPPAYRPDRADAVLALVVALAAGLAFSAAALAR